MQGDIFAWMMIAMLCPTIVLLKVFGRRPDRRAVFSGIVIMVVTFLALSFFAFGHLCFRGGPVGTVFFGAFSAGLLRATMENKKWRRIVWICWFALVLWGTSLCHEDGYIGNITYGQRLNERSSRSIEQSKEVLRKAAESGKGFILREGWIDQSWETATHERFPVPTKSTSATTTTFWHTRFTGIFSFQTQDCGIWCPGGSLMSCSKSLELRPTKQ